MMQSEAKQAGRWLLVVHLEVLQWRPCTLFIVVDLRLVELGARRITTNSNSQSHTTKDKQVFCLYASSYYLFEVTHQF